MKNTIIALLIFNLIGAYIYYINQVGEIRSDLRVEQELNKACSAQLMWLEMKIKQSQI